MAILGTPVHTNAFSTSQRSINLDKRYRYYTVIYVQ